MSKLFDQYKRLSLIDFLRKIIHFIICRRDINLVRKAKSLFYFKTTDVILGKSVKIMGLPMQIHIGKQVRIYDKCILEFGAESIVSVGSNTIFSYGVILSCRSRIVIGNDVQIGEYTSLRDTTHTYNDTSKPMRELPDIASAITIGNDVWIGRGCIIMPGTIIEDGVVIAANSVAKGRMEKNSIYGGTPAKLIKYRV
jgi:acetyltransferase-like isoleucine patch superfamily enzyme